MLNIVTLVVLGAMSLTSRSLAGSWLAPSAFFSLCWTCYFAAAVAAAGLFPLCPPGSWLLVSMVLAFQLGALAVDYSAVTVSPSSAVEHPRGLPPMLERRLVTSTAVLTGIAGVGVAALIYTGVVSFGLSWSTAVLLSLAHMFSVARYEGAEHTPFLVTLMIYTALPAAVLGGLLAGVATKRTHRVLAVAPLICSLGNSVVVAARLAFILAVVMWFSALAAMRAFRLGARYRVFRPRWAIGAMTIVGVVVGIFTLLQWLRGGGAPRFNVSYVLEQALASSIGSVATFTTWFCNSEPARLSWGAYTFAGPFSLFGLASRDAGLFDAAIYFPSGHSSNIYTIFRSLLEDFGQVGAWIMLLGAGALSAWAYRRCTEGGVRWCLVLAVFYSVTVLSLLTTMFAYNSPIMGWLIASVVWLWPPYRARWSIMVPAALPPAS